MGAAKSKVSQTQIDRWIGTGERNHLGKSIKDRVAQWKIMKALEPDITNAEVARRLGIAPGTLRNLLYKAGRFGLLAEFDTITRLENEIIPKAVDNLSRLLDEQDKTATLETMKGTAFKQFLDAKGISEAPKQILALKIEAVPVDQQKVITGHIIGAPRLLEEETDEPQSQS